MEGRASDIAAQKERHLLSRFDRRILPYVAWLYLLSFLDRSNISNVKRDLEESLGLEAGQYAKAVGIFYIGYILFEIPSNMVLKKVRPSIWIGLIVAGWGICSVCMIFAQDFVDLLLIRMFLGIAEAGFFPGIVFYLTFWYKKSEQGLRIALFYCSSALAGAVGGLMAYGILQMQNVGSLEPWQWLFLLEGVPSVFFGFVTMLYLPNYPEDSKWLSEEERLLAISRLPNQNQQSHNKIDTRALFDTLMSPKIWGFAINLFCLVTPTYAVSFYLPTLLESFGYEKLESNLLSSPIYFVSAVVIIVTAWNSDRLRERPLHLMAGQIVCSLGFGLVSVGSHLDNTGLQFFAMFLATAGCTMGIPLCLAWLTNMIHGSTRSATATGLVVGFANFGGMIGPNLYSYLAVYDDDGSENYFAGHLVMACIAFVGVITTLLVKIFAHEDPEESKLGSLAETEPLIVNHSQEKLYT